MVVALFIGTLVVVQVGYLFTTSTSIASTDIITDTNGAPCIKSAMAEDAPTSGMFTNGWSAVGGFGTGTHTYQVTVTGYATDDTELVSGTFFSSHSHRVNCQAGTSEVFGIGPYADNLYRKTFKKKFLID